MLNIACLIGNEISNTVNIATKSATARPCHLSRGLGHKQPRLLSGQNALPSAAEESLTRLRISHEAVYGSGRYERIRNKHQQVSRREVSP